MNNWIKSLRHDPIPILLSKENNAIKYFVRKDLLEQKVESANLLWKLPEVDKMLKKQLKNGSWKYSSSKKDLRSQENYDQLEDPRIEKGFKSLLSVRQEDGGWAIPIRTNNAKWSEVMDIKEILQPKKDKPFSHMVTGVALRAFAAHPKYSKIEEAKHGVELLASRFFKPDKYPDRKAVDYWFRVSFPFWFTDIVSSLDTLSNLGFTPSHPQIEFALETLRERQLENGLWDLKLLKTKDKDLPLWIALAICRILKKFY